MGDSLCKYCGEGMRLEDNRFDMPGGREVRANRFWMECTNVDCLARGPRKGSELLAREAVQATGGRGETNGTDAKLGLGVPRKADPDCRVPGKADPDCPYCDGDGITGGIDGRVCHCREGDAA